MIVSLASSGGRQLCRTTRCRVCHYRIHRKCPSKLINDSSSNSEYHSAISVPVYCKAVIQLAIRSRNASTDFLALLKGQFRADTASARNRSDTGAESPLSGRISSDSAAVCPVMSEHNAPRSIQASRAAFWHNDCGCLESRVERPESRAGVLRLETHLQSLDSSQGKR